MLGCMRERASCLDAESGLAPVSSLSIVAAQISVSSANISSPFMYRRTEWCCQFVGESIVGLGDSASAPSQAFAWCGTTCGTVDSVSIHAKHMAARIFRPYRHRECVALSSFVVVRDSLVLGHFDFS